MTSNLETSEIEVERSQESNKDDITKSDEKNLKDFDNSQSESIQTEISDILDFLAKKDLKVKDIYPQGKCDSVELKNQGNINFEKKEYLKALNLYKVALDTAKDKTLIRNLFSNISKCFINLELYEDAIVYANSSLKIDPNFKKPQIRKAIAMAYCQ